ncbi:MAG: porin family protein [Gemmatimonadota bacterium]|nr:porin family protein [Gemmatimonadota bacterium]MDE2871209.1 porin family protein [Gemmatimonadota bacterium]
MTIRSFLRSLFTVSALLVPASLAAQTYLSVGGGLTLSELRMSNLSGYRMQTPGMEITLDSRTGITAAVELTRPLSGSVALRIGGAYVQKGRKMNFRIVDPNLRQRVVTPGDSWSSTRKLHYLELTALAQPTFSLGASMGEGSTSFHLLAGPALGILMRCSTECSDDYWTGMDLGVLAGAGIRMGRFRLDATYTLGIMDVNSADSEDDYGPGSQKNRSIALRAGFVIPLVGGS